MNKQLLKADFHGVVYATNVSHTSRKFMKYPVVVREENGAFSATVPDLPGVITEVDSLDELEGAVIEAASGWMEAELDAGRAIPLPSPFASLKSDDEYKDFSYFFFDIDLEALSDNVERVDIRLPSRALRRLDYLASKAGMSRSGYLTKMIYTLSE